MSSPDTIKRSDLENWVGVGQIQGASYKQGLDFFREAKAWDRWALMSLFGLGVGHILAGIIFFFAFNWNDLSAGIKFAIVQGGIVTTVLMWLAFKLDHVAGQAFGIAATVLVGVLLAVFGQVFQTPAAIYTPFVLWTALTLPFAVVSKSVAHWAVWAVIALVGALTFIGDGLASMADKDVVRLAYLGLALVCLCLSAVYHKLSQTRFPWAQTRWFRLCLIVAAFGIMFCVFTEDFWLRETTYIWALALVLAGGALTITYKKLPTLPALSLMTFFIATMAAQFGFRFIFDTLPMPDVVSGALIRMLLTFIWMAGITYVLAKAFRHYQDKFGVSEMKDETGKEEGKTLSKTVTEFISYMSRHKVEISEDLDRTSQDDTPWYVEVLLGISGIVTAIFAGLFVSSIVALFFSDNIFLASLVIGLVVWAGALMLRLKTQSKFARHFFNTLMIGGASVAMIGLRDLFSGGIIYIIGSVIILGIMLYLVKDRFIEFITAMGLFGFVSYVFEHYGFPRPYIWLCLFFMPLAAAALVLPWRKRVFSAAGAAFLFCVPLAGLAYYYKDSIYDSSTGSDWLEMVVSLIVAFGVIVGLNFIDKKTSDFRPSVFVLVPLLSAMAFMPAGSAAALLAVIVGYILGSRAITLVGILMQIYFLVLFYYDLQTSLLNKSILLMVSGLIFVGIWFVFRNRMEVQDA